MSLGSPPTGTQPPASPVPAAAHSPRIRPICFRSVPRRLSATKTLVLSCSSIGLTGCSPTVPRRCGTDLVLLSQLCSFCSSTLSVASHQPVSLPIRLARTRRCLMNGEPVTDLTTAVYEMRSVSLQNRNFDILPRHMGHLGLYWDEDDEEGDKRSKEGLKGLPTVIFVFPQGGEQFTTRKAHPGVQRHPTTRGWG